MHRKGYSSQRNTHRRYTTQTSERLPETRGVTEVNRIAQCSHNPRGKIRCKYSTSNRHAQRLPLPSSRRRWTQPLSVHSEPNVWMFVSLVFSSGVICKFKLSICISPDCALRLYSTHKLKLFFKMRNVKRETPKWDLLNVSIQRWMLAACCWLVYSTYVVSMIC